MAFLSVRKPGVPPMRPSVLAAFVPFTEKFEGKCSWMYLDVSGLVTTGRGNLIDPVDAALALPWRFQSKAATPEQVRAAWNTVKGAVGMKARGGLAFAVLTALRLTDQALEDLTQAKLHAMWLHLAAECPWLGDAPADAQLGAISMAWAMGEGFVRDFPRWNAACAAGDWATARQECLATKPPVPVARNAANQVLFGNAFLVNGTDPDVLHWPADLSHAAPPRV